MFGKLINRISLFFFKYISNLLKHKLTNLNKILKYTDISEDTTSYISDILFISFFIGFLIEILMIFLMINLNIFFSIFSFIVSLFISFTFASMILFVLYRYPFYITNTKKKELDLELELDLKHLSVLEYKSLTVLDVLNIFKKLNNNRLLTKETAKILSISNLNNNLESTIRHVSKHSCSELEQAFFRKLIDVLNNKVELKDVIDNFLSELKLSKKEEDEQRKSKINLLFITNIFLFFFVLILLSTIFFIPSYKTDIKRLLQFIAIIFPIIEIILIIILNK